MPSEMNVISNIYYDSITVFFQLVRGPFTLGRIYHGRKKRRSSIGSVSRWKIFDIQQPQSKITTRQGRAI
ncbi:hypothetical protein [Viridibacillus arvi]|uniref:hypothetical protein n=1 Tax=Viridibacillus arvi TaxID=263475 RepID=UPI003D060645